MNVYLLCATVLSGSPLAPRDVDDVIQPVSHTSYVARGQTPAPVYQDQTGFQPTYQPPAYDGGASGGNAFQGGPQPIGDPFLGGGGGLGPQSYAVAGTQFPFGLYDFTPMRPWQVDASVGVIPTESISRGGEFGVIEYDVSASNTLEFGTGFLTLTPQFGQRFWDGPPGAGGQPSFGLPSTVYRLGMDFEYRTRTSGPWGFVAGFNPSINSDFDAHLKSDAYNWDGRGYLTYSHSESLMLVGGVGFWDRVNDRFIPYAGAIWKPTSRLEIHATVPEARVSYFVGRGGSTARWIYARAEYHVEAYQVETGSNSGIGTRMNDKFEVEDYRILLGYAINNGYVDMFVEGGWVLARETDFLRDTQPDFSISDGFIGRLGIRF